MENYSFPYPAIGAPSLQEITSERGEVRGTNVIEKSTRTIMRLL